MTEERPYRQFPVNLPTDLYEAFFKLFPDYGARSVFIREAIRAALRQVAKPNGSLDVNSATQTALSSVVLRLRTGQK